MTLSVREVVQIEADASPGWFAARTADDYKGDALPLWRFVQQPASR